MRYTVFDKKTILKWDKELVDLHKRVITTYLVSHGVSASTRYKFFKLYDYYITEENVRDYFFTPTKVLVISIVKGQVDQVSKYITYVPSKRKKSVHRKNRP